ncbi:MAG: SLC13 family permease [Leadbetterella sp.]
MKRNQTIGFLISLVIFLVFFLSNAPVGLSVEGWHSLGILLILSVLWIFEVFPIFFTSFLPMILFPLVKGIDAKTAASSIGNVYTMMLIAGFWISKALESQNLHKRFSLWIFSKLSTQKTTILLVFMSVSAFLSMWMANVAVALLMLPIASSIVQNLEDESDFSQALYLGVAYACSIGGVATLVGTPVNMVFVGIFKNLFPKAPEVSFLQWFLMGFPVCILFILVTWWGLKVFFKITGSLKLDTNKLKDDFAKLGSLDLTDYTVIIVFVLIALSWIFRLDLDFGNSIIPGWSESLGMKKYFEDYSLAILLCGLFFIVTKKGKPILTWKEASNIQWGVVIIVAAGFCISDVFKNTGLAEWLAIQLKFISGQHTLLMMFLIVCIILVLTEVNSNTATANIALPIFASMALSSSLNPLFLMVPVALTSSFGFMMPAGTATNAVVFASEKVELKKMIKIGFYLNLASILILTLYCTYIALPIMGITADLPSWAK